MLKHPKSTQFHFFRKVVKRQCTTMGKCLYKHRKMLYQRNASENPELRRFYEKGVNWCEFLKIRRLSTVHNNVKMFVQTLFNNRSISKNHYFIEREVNDKWQLNDWKSICSEIATLDVGCNPIFTNGLCNSLTSTATATAKATRSEFFYEL